MTPKCEKCGEPMYKEFSDAGITLCESCWYMSDDPSAIKWREQAAHEEYMNRLIEEDYYRRQPHQSSGTQGPYIKGMQI